MGGGKVDPLVIQPTFDADEDVVSNVPQKIKDLIDGFDLLGK